VHHGPLSPAEQAWASGDAEKATDLWRAQFKANPGDTPALVGLVHGLLRTGNIDEAEKLVNDALATSPNSASMGSLRGDVEYRQGLPWKAAESANEATRLDPCNAQNMLLVAKIDRLNSMYASGRRMVETAAKLDPENPEVQRAVAMWNPGSAHAEAQARTCHLASSVDKADIPLVRLLAEADRPVGWGIVAKLGDRSVQLQVDTGASGLVINRTVAEKLGLKPEVRMQLGGIGDEGFKEAYEAYVDSIRVGGMEFRDCSVMVMNAKQTLNSSDGLIGMDVFSNFLVKLDYPMHKLLLGPLPPRPQQSSPAVNEARTTASAGSELGLYNRYIAPEMKDWTPIYRVGHDLLLPVSIEGRENRLFIVDTGSFATVVSPAAASTVTKLRGGSGMEVQGLSGKVKTVKDADFVAFHFAHLVQKVENVTTFDMSGISRGVGMDVSGFLGATTLNVLTISVDYRDGLMKFEYDPNRGYRMGNQVY